MTVGDSTTSFGDCPNENCALGDIHWTWWESSGARLKAGSCDSCGAWAVECPECDEINLADGGGTCFSCETKISLVSDRDNIEVQSVEVEAGGKTRSYEATGDTAPAPRDSPEP